MESENSQVISTVEAEVPTNIPDEEIMPCECRLDKPASEFRELICFNTFFAFFI